MRQKLNRLGPIINKPTLVRRHLKATEIAEIAKFLVRLFWSFCTFRLSRLPGLGQHWVIECNAYQVCVLHVHIDYKLLNEFHATQPRPSPPAQQASWEFSDCSF